MTISRICLQGFLWALGDIFDSKMRVMRRWRNKGCIYALQFSTETSKSNGQMSRRKCDWFRKEKETSLPSWKKGGLLLRLWNACMRSVKENTYFCSGLTDTGEGCWHACDLFASLGPSWRGATSDTVQAVQPIWTHTDEHFKSVASFAIKLSSCSVRRAVKMLHFPSAFVSFPASPLPISRYISRTWWNLPTFEEACSKPPSSFQSRSRSGPTAPQGHTNFVRYPTLSAGCGWDIFHPLNWSQISLQSLENATASSLWQSKHYIKKEFAQKDFSKEA